MYMSIPLISNMKLHNITQRDEVDYFFVGTMNNCD